MPCNFAATTTAAGRELWKTDGTPGEATLVVDLVPGTGDSNPQQMLGFDGQLFFAAGKTDTVYRTDGNTATIVIDGDKRWSPGTQNSSTQAVSILNGKLVLKQESASGIDLLTMTSATAVPQVFQHFQPANSTDYYIVDGFTIANNTLFFRRVARGVAPATGFLGEVWKSDGTLGGTVALVSPPFFFLQNAASIGFSSISIGFYPEVQTSVAGEKLVFFEDGITFGSHWTNGGPLTQFPSPSTGSGTVVPLFGQKLIQAGSEMFYLSGDGLVRINAALTTSNLIQAPQTSWTATSAICGTCSGLSGSPRPTLSGNTIQQHQILRPDLSFRPQRNPSERPPSVVPKSFILPGILYPMRCDTT